ncbi:alpha/beta fold hydrolase [[Mycobacterium] burgundiense]|uniref:Alpha/beta hydrolase n=1 Tax=[Mycobacterium] burgundiense TaxID=3064286 RepID=A0ABN9NFG1_9MYCO|nr:alpha/beta hydrolase [Mycolicibacterium sp. MU0053]CAJ1503756.1 alpha/beta hydrolase [Mycolicibacterium sp. MU0053]
MTFDEAGTAIAPQFITIDGVRIRYAESGPAGVDAILLSPWPETVYAFDQVWATLAGNAHLVAVDPPGFGASEGRADLLNPNALGEFVVHVADAFGMARPHLVGPDIGTSAALFAAAGAPARFASVVVGSGGAAVPIDVAGPLEDWVFATDLQVYRDIGGEAIVEAALATISGYTPPQAIRDDYLTCYAGDRFADTIPYAQSYRHWLPVLADVLPSITTPVRVIAGSADQVVPQVNATYLAERLPFARVDLIDGAGHFVWEEQPHEYAALVAQWWAQN